MIWLLHSGVMTIFSILFGAMLPDALTFLAPTDANTIGLVVSFIMMLYVADRQFGLFHILGLRPAEPIRTTYAFQYRLPVLY